MSEYLVTGQLRYREHEPGERFIADLDRDEEARAVRHGAIKVISRAPLTVNLANTRPPRGWAPARST